MPPFIYFSFWSLSSPAPQYQCMPDVCLTIIFHLHCRGFGPLLRLVVSKQYLFWTIASVRPTYVRTSLGKIIVLLLLLLTVPPLGGLLTGNRPTSFTPTNDSSVESVRVAWSEPSPPPDATTSPLLFDHPRSVRIHAYPTTSINNRYTPFNNATVVH